MGTKKKVIYEGKEYDSYAELCREKGISYNAFTQRLRKGLPLEECLAKVCRKQEVEVFGQKYKNQKQACDVYGKSQRLVKSRMHYGWSLEDALTKEIYKGKPIGYNGKIYKKKKDLADTLGINHSLFYSYTREKTVDEALKSYHPQGVSVFKGDDSKILIKDLIKKIGISKETLRLRYNKGFTRKEAITQGKHCSIYRVKYLNFYEVCNCFQISIDCFIKGILEDKSYEQIIEENSKVKKIKYQGKVYPNYFKLAEDLEMSANLIQNRLKEGYSLEESIAEPYCFSLPDVFVFKGKEYRNLEELCEELSLFNANRKYRVLKLLEKGYDIEEMICLVLARKKSNITIDGKVYASLMAFCKTQGIDTIQYMREILGLS